MEKQNGDKEAFCALGLRPATAADEAFLRALFASTRAHELALMNWDENQKQAFVAMQFNAQSRQYEMSYPQANHHIVLWENSPIGRLLVDRGQREFTLVDVALVPAYRNVGIGTHLLQNLLLEAEAAGKPVKLSVWHTNPAKRLYERMGFSTDETDGVYCEMLWKASQPIN